MVEPECDVVVPEIFHSLLGSEPVSKKFGTGKKHVAGHVKFWSLSRDFKRSEGFSIFPLQTTFPLKACYPHIPSWISYLYPISQYKFLMILVEIFCKVNTDIIMMMKNIMMFDIYQYQKYLVLEESIGIRIV